jgi:hypothetical protein
LATEAARQPDDKDLAKLLYEARSKLLYWESGAKRLHGPIKLEEWLELVWEVQASEGPK